MDPDRKPGTGKMADFCPSLWGGKNWPPIAFSPTTRMIYIPANNNLCGGFTGVKVEYVAGRGYTGTSNNTSSFNPGADHFGEVQAWNVDTGQRAFGKVTVEPAVDDMTGQQVFLLTPNKAPFPSKAPDAAQAPLYLVAYPTSSTITRGEPSTPRIWTESS